MNSFTSFYVLAAMFCVLWSLNNQFVEDQVSFFCLWFVLLSAVRVMVQIQSWSFIAIFILWGLNNLCFVLLPESSWEASNAFWMWTLPLFKKQFSQFKVRCKFSHSQTAWSKLDRVCLRPSSIRESGSSFAMLCLIFSLKYQETSHKIIFFFSFYIILVSSKKN